MNSKNPQNWATFGGVIGGGGSTPANLGIFDPLSDFGNDNTNNNRIYNNNNNSNNNNNNNSNNPFDQAEGVIGIKSLNRPADLVNNNNKPLNSSVNHQINSTTTTITSAIPNVLLPRIAKQQQQAHQTLPRSQQQQSTTATAATAAVMQFDPFSDDFITNCISNNNQDADAANNMIVNNISNPALHPPSPMTSLLITPFKNITIDSTLPRSPLSVTATSNPTFSAANRPQDQTNNNNNKHWKPQWQQDVDLPPDLITLIEKNLDKCVHFTEFFNHMDAAQREYGRQVVERRALSTTAQRVGKTTGGFLLRGSIRKSPQAVSLEKEMEALISGGEGGRGLPDPVSMRARLEDVLPFQLIMGALSDPSGAPPIVEDGDLDMNDSHLNDPASSYIPSKLDDSIKSINGGVGVVVATKIPSLPTHMVEMSQLEIALYYYEKGLLDICYFYLSKSASEHDPLGLLLMSTALRNGWGTTPRDTVLAFTTLVGAVKASLFASTTGLKGTNSTVSSSSGPPSMQHPDITIPLALVPLCLYEMAVCFRNGWGIIKSKAFAAYCFSIAARLGDAESQMELATCYLSGIGCKKDKMQGARWLREASQRGKDLVGESWIWKKKWGGTEET